MRYVKIILIIFFIVSGLSLLCAYAVDESQYNKDTVPVDNNYACQVGTVIRGSTPHFDYIAAEVSKGVAKVSLDAGIPVIFGVITADTIEQAIERAGTKDGNKGKDAAVSAIEMVNLIAQIK